MMRIILREDVPNLGVVGDLVSVKDGYARNYLIPEGKAVFASVKSMRELEHQKRLAAHHRKKATAEAEVVKTRVESLAVVMHAKVAPPQLGEDGEPIKEIVQKLFGSITNRDITKVLKDSGVDVGHRRLVINEAVRTVGKYVATIRLDGGIVAKLPFWVIPEGTANVEAEKKRVEEAQTAAREAEKKAFEEEQKKQAALAAEMALEMKRREEEKGKADAAQAEKDKAAAADDGLA
jgi:large subunit ribosomal protein L9